MNRIYICNIGGGHGHFLQWVLDKFCTETAPIDTIPFDSIGASHLDWWDSGKFRFVDDTEYEKSTKYVCYLQNSIPTPSEGARIVSSKLT